MKQKSSQGFSILEVLVAITISLILMLGILQIFVASKNTYRLENNQAILQENVRFAHDYLNKIIRNTAYRSAITNTKFTAIDTLFTGGTTFISGTNNSGHNGSDTLTIRYQGSGNGAGVPDGTVRDCLDRPVDSLITTTVTLSINASNQLICQASNASAAPVSDSQAILSDVENMQILYGEDIDGDKTPDRFVSSAHPSLDFDRVVSIKLSLLFRSIEQNNPLPDNNTYNLLGTTHTATGDRFIRQMLTFTVTLRNVVTEVVL